MVFYIGMKGNVIKKERVVIDNKEYDISMSSDGGIGEPEVILHKKEGIVESIDVICTCGRKLHIVCEYDPTINPAEGRTKVNGESEP